MIIHSRICPDKTEDGVKGEIDILGTTELYSVGIHITPNTRIITPDAHLVSITGKEQAVPGIVNQTHTQHALEVLAQ